MSINYWCSPDIEENYKPFINGKKNYSKTEILYDYNKEGFRCDDFDFKTSHPLLFMGCSFTEGVGLPLDEVYAYHIHQRYQKYLGINIPFWSLAKGGTSIDYAARMLYQFYNILKPKYIIYLMSGFYRREYCYENKYLNWYPNPSPLHKSDDNFKNVGKFYSDASYAAYQSYRSLIILNNICKDLACKIYLFDMFLYKQEEQVFVDQVKQFDQIIYTPLSNLKYNSNLSIPDKILNRPLKARDCLHRGANWHYNIGDAIWNFFSANEKL